MALLRVVKYGNPILRVKSKPVNEIDDSIRQLAADMIETMQDSEGIGLAASQISKSIALFVIDMSLITDDGKPMAVINFEILETNGQISFEEGCLCIPEVRENVKRPEIIKVKYLDIDGNLHEEELDGLKARVFQHEFDHLNGILFVDRIGTMKRKLLNKQLQKIADEELDFLNI